MFVCCQHHVCAVCAKDTHVLHVWAGRQGEAVGRRQLRTRPHSRGNPWLRLTPRDYLTLFRLFLL